MSNIGKNLGVISAIPLRSKTFVWELRRIGSKAYLNRNYGNFGPLAHLVEQLTLNQWVAGSTPAWPI